MALAQGFMAKVDVEQTGDDFKICTKHRDQGNQSGASGGGAGSGGSSLAISCRDTDGNALEDPAQPVGGIDAGCNINCTDTNPEMRLVVSGGLGPYTWGAVSSGGGASPTLVTSGPGFQNVTVTPPTSVTVAGTAYNQVWMHCTVGWNGSTCTGGGNTLNQDRQQFGCEDETEASCLASTAGTGGGQNCATVSEGGAQGCTGPDTQYCADGDVGSAGQCASHSFSPKRTCDRRSQSMIDSGCVPCGASMSGAVVTVTDALGNSVSLIVGVGNQTAA